MAGTAGDSSTPWMTLDEAVAYRMRLNGGVESLACAELETAGVNGDCYAMVRGFDAVGRYQGLNLNKRDWRQVSIARSVTRQRNPKTGEMEVVESKFVLQRKLPRKLLPEAPTEAPAEAPVAATAESTAEYRPPFGTVFVGYVYVYLWRAQVEAIPEPAGPPPADGLPTTHAEAPVPAPKAPPAEPTASFAAKVGIPATAKPKRLTAKAWVADAVKQHPRPEGVSNYAEYLHSFAPRDKWEVETISNELGRLNKPEKCAHKNRPRHK
jgi:hypothetical protein